MFINGKIVTVPFRDQVRPGPLGVRKYVRHKCYHGYTLFSTAMGSTEYLIDMNGMVVHTWPITHSQYGELLPNGNLMADNYGFWLEEINTAGERVWIWEGPYHHDFHFVSDEEIVFLTNEQVPPVKGYYPAGGEPKRMKSDTVLCVNRKGKVLWRFPFYEHIEELHELAGLPLPVRYAGIEADGAIVDRNHTNAGGHDWAHCNTIEVLPDTPIGRADKRFRKGNLLFSLRALDIIGVADVKKNKIVWAWGLGVLDGQHQPVMTEKGTILVFDNGTARGYSAVVEIDPRTNTEVWRYEDRAGFFSPYRSGVQRLPNGNTLIAESDAGRIFEVTPDKEVVWDYYNLFLCQQPGNQGLHVYRATRYAYDDPKMEKALAPRFAEKISSMRVPHHPPIRTYGEAAKFYRDALGG